MIRKISSTSLALFLLLIIAGEHYALGFCQCSEQLVFLNSYGCHENHHDLKTPGDCCSGQSASPAPCHDCVIPLVLDPGEFFWSADPQLSKDRPALSSTAVTTPAPALPDPVTGQPAAYPVRGSPPGLPPLFLRNRVMRL